MFARRLCRPCIIPKTVTTHIMAKRGHISEHGRILRMLVKTGCWEKLPRKNQQVLLKTLADDIEDADSYGLFPFVAMKACCRCFKIGKLAYKFPSKWEEITYCRNCLLGVMVEEILSKTWNLFTHEDVERVIQRWDVSSSEYFPLIVKALKKTPDIKYQKNKKYFVRI